RTARQSVRARPGTFEWRYAREANKKTGDGALYYAGSDFARIWERAGLAAPGSVDWSSAGQSQWKGLPDGRAVAIDEVGKAERKIGQMNAAVLRAYCVRGETTSQIARAFEVSEREMASFLKAALIAAALHFRYL